MRKLGKENWKLFVLLSILTVIIIIIFIFFIRYALSGDNSYQIDAGTVFFDENYIPVSFDTESELKKRFDGNYYLISDDSNKPIILSASLIADISAVVTTNALSAPAIAFLNPCSIPAGQSINM